MNFEDIYKILTYIAVGEITAIIMTLLAALYLSPDAASIYPLILFPYRGVLMWGSNVIFLWVFGTAIVLWAWGES